MLWFWAGVLPKAWAQDAQGYYQEALSAYENRQLEVALQQLNQALAADTAFAPAYARRGLLYYEWSDYPAAISDYNQALSLAPEAETYYQRASAYTQLGQYTIALADLDQALAIAPKATYLVLKGVLLEQTNKLKQADQAYTAALALDETYTLAYYNRALLYFEQYNKPKASLIDLNQALALVPDYADALLLRAGIYLDQKKWTDALADYDKVLTKDHQNAQAYLGKGYAYWGQKSPLQACQAWQKAAALGSLDAQEALQTYCP
ncbi:tetratricopeptide repeat protein [Eisenibacter elegans]|uniref:tetratricopeptide repeat protein n=1 Tax=Eisenibacter elegans TaxID=997 RepID=UPI00040D5C49|nr:tetratricopeptide repeat protein [Eisenibacter elegans]